MSAKRASFIGIAGSPPSMSSRFLHRFETVAYAADGRNPDSARLELLAKPVHVDLDRIGADFLAPRAKMLDELVLGDETAGPLEKKLEQPQFARGQVESFSSKRGNASYLVEAKCAVFDERGRAEHPPACQRAHTGLELGQLKRLRQVVVGAGVESAHAIVGAVERGEQQH